MPMQYDLLDWVAVASSLLAVYLFGQRNRLGFACFLFSNACWMVVGVLPMSYGILLGNIAFFVLNLRGFAQWRPEPEMKAVAGGCP